VSNTDLPTGDTSFYARASVELRKSLAHALPRETVRELQRRRPWRHFLVLTRMVVVLTLSTLGGSMTDRWYLFLPCSIMSGFTLFGFTVLLHEIVHSTVFAARPRASRALGWFYAFPSGISRSQFTRWHLDHHAQLGDAVADPKRHHLSPKQNARWLKLLYLTPALFFIYFRAAGRETGSYSTALRARIARERAFTVFGQVTILTVIVLGAGGWVAFKVYILPYFVVFPVAFVLNRLGQHYDIDPTDPTKWSTLMAASRWWDFWFLWSRYHLEHHYFPSVPFYNLRRLHHLLQPFYRERAMTPRTYRGILWQWLVENRAPHTDWSLPSRGSYGPLSPGGHAAVPGDGRP
jgi:beta-carotene hydroxylase